jgi:hypothetical protein
MGDTDTLPIFESAAKGITNNIADASPKEIVLICRLTFKGIEDMLTGRLKDIPEKSVFAAEDAIDWILEKYRELRRKGGVEFEILTEIDDIMPELIEAISQINTAADQLRRKANRKQNNDAYNKTDYNRAVLMSQEQVAKINRMIGNFDDIVIDSG